jgi:hypothetical protein
VDEPGRGERVVGGVLFAGAAWLAVGVLLWLVWVVTGRVSWLPWLPQTLIAAAVPYAQARAALLLVRPRAGATAPGAATGAGLGLAAGLATGVIPLVVTGASLGLLPALAPLAVLVTVLCGFAALALLVVKHGLGLDQLSGPPAALATSATAFALVWAGLALDQGSLTELLPAIPAAVVVALAALGGPPGYRTGLVQGWWWAMVATAGSLLVTGLYLGIGYGQAWAWLIVIGAVATLAAARWAVRSVPADR